MAAAGMPSLEDIAATTDANARSQQFAQYLKNAVNEPSLPRLRDVVTLTVDDSFPQVVALSLLREFCTHVTSLGDPDYKALAIFALEALQPRAHVFEGVAADIRDRLASVLEREGNFSDAARTLAAIPVDAVQVTIAQEDYKVRMFVRIARLFVRAKCHSEAEKWATKASVLVHQCGDEGVQLHYRTVYAQLLDYKLKYVDAALKYYQLSQMAHRLYGPESLTASDTNQALQYATTCAILAPAGPRRSRVLAALYKDERSRSNPLFGLLEAIHMDRLLQAEQVEALRPLLQPHQLDAKVDDESVLDRAVVEHNLLAASKLYCNIKFDELGSLLRISPEKAETTAARMVNEDRMKASLDQVTGFIEFTADNQVERILSWDQQIESVCGALDNCVDAIIQKHPQFAS